MTVYRGVITMGANPTAVNFIVRQAATLRERRWRLCYLTPLSV